MTSQTLARPAPSLARLALAFVCAAAAPMIPFALWTMVSNPHVEDWRDSAILMFAFSGAAIVAGVPAYFILRRRLDLTAFSATLAGMGIVVVVALCVGLFIGVLGGSPTLFGVAMLFAVVYGMLCSPLGAIGGWVFWAIAGRLPRAAPL